MLRAFWTWNQHPDKKHFFDKSVWQKMLRAMHSCGFDSVIFADGQPTANTPIDYRNMYKWIFETALDYGIAPYVMIGVPDDADKLEFACVSSREMLESYPELKGVFLSSANQAIVDAIDAARPDASIYICADFSDPKPIADAVKRRGGRRINYSVKYTGNYLVDADFDPAFAAWVDAAGAENIAAEFTVANFEPWTSFSYDTVEGVLANLSEMGCGGLSLHPLSISQWPHSSDAFFKYQWQRDLIWYYAWAGKSVEQLARQGQPKWLARNVKVMSGFEAGSRIMELLSLYFAGNKLTAWKPQHCSFICDSNTHLLTIEDMLHLDSVPEFSALNWWTEITGDRVVHLGEYIASATPENAYGPEELIEELADLCELAISSGEKGMRSASGEKELPSFARDAFCMGKLGEFYVERLRAALCHARHNDSEAAEHLARALGLYREMAEVDSSHREVSNWANVIKMLEAEYADATNGVFKQS